MNAIVVDVKSDYGYIAFQSENPLIAEVDAMSLVPGAIAECAVESTRTRLAPLTWMLPDWPDAGVSCSTPSATPPADATCENVVALVDVTMVN